MQRSTPNEYQRRDNNTIIVDGEEHPIIVPSGEQTGVKFDGPFELPSGRFFRFPRSKGDYRYLLLLTNRLDWHTYQILKT